MTLIRRYPRRLAGWEGLSLPRSCADDDHAAHEGDDRPGEAAVRDEDDTARDEEHGTRNRGGGACLEAVEHSMRDSTRCLCHSMFGGLVPQARTRTLS